MKTKRILIFVLLASLIICGNSTTVWSGNNDSKLVNLLIKKGIITQTEADQLMEETISTAAEEKAEIKKELKTEIQEDIKKDAVKGEFLPPALKGFKFGTTIYAEWNSINRSSGPGKNTNQFSLNRAYVTLTKDFNDWLGMNITSDLFTPRDPNDVNNGLQLRIKYAFVDLKLLGTESMLGMIPTPSDYYDSAIWPYRVQGNNLLDGLGIQATADMGIVNMGIFGGYMNEEYQQYAAKPFAGKWGGYMVGLYNGSGFDTPERNQNKVVSGLVYARLFPATPILKGLQLAYVGTYGESNTNFTSGNGRTTSYPTWQVNIAQASLQHSYFTIIGQYYWGIGTKSSDEENNRRAYLLAAFLRIPTMEKLRVFGKWYNFDPNTHLSTTHRSVHVAGLSYDVTKEFMPFVAWEHQNTSLRSGLIGYDKYQAGFQLKY